MALLLKPSCQKLFSEWETTITQTLALIMHLRVIRLNTAFTLHSTHSSCSRTGNTPYAHAQSSTLGQTVRDPPGPIQMLCESLKTNHWTLNMFLIAELRSYRPPASKECSLRKRKSLRSNWVTEDEGVWNNIPCRCWLWAGRGRGCNTYNRWEDQELNLHKSTCFRPRPLWVMLSFNIWTVARFLTVVLGAKNQNTADDVLWSYKSLSWSPVLVPQQVTSCFKE